jgi:hypothetical protein
MAKLQERPSPDKTLQRALGDQGFSTQCMWEIPGPKNTGIAWLTCYNSNGTVFMVQTYKEGGWQVYLPSVNLLIDKTVEEVIDRVRRE